QLTAIRGTIAACTSSVSQSIATSLLQQPEGRRWMTAIADHCRCAVKTVVSGLTEVGLSPTSSGGIYAWARQALVSTDEESVLSLPGGPAAVASGRLFGDPSHVRVCPAREMTVLENAFMRPS